MKIIYKLLRSVVHRSGILIDVRNLILKMNFNINDEMLNQNCEKFKRQLIKMSTDLPLIMIGASIKDGSYPILTYENFKKIKVISIGVGNNIIFDEAISNLGATVWCFDHTVAPRIKNKHKHNIFYKPFGIKGTTPIPKCKSLKEIIQLTEDTKVFDATILKLDCEGVEWDVLTSNSIKLLSQFDQIIVELHNLDRFSDVNFAKMALKNFKKLENDFLVTYLAPNNFTPIVRLANDLLWPFTLEVLLVNKKLVKKSNIEVMRRNTMGALFKKKNHWNLAPRVNLESWYEIDQFT